ncbi:MAG: aminotransferase class IV [Thermoanaerobacteraceae bacterium]|nr:aminotransferase class IV [Thermoanaerobacteraceae bacterium]
MYVYLNGQIKPKEEVALSVDDRGFTFGEGVYEVVRVYGRVPFLLAEHMERLERSAAEMEIPLPEYFTLGHWQQAISQLVEKNNLPECFVYLQLTRGVQFRNHAFKDDLQPTTVMYLIAGKSWDQERQGVKATLADDIRWHRCDVKSTMLMANTLAKTRAARQGYFEVIFERDGWITEGSSSNVFFVKNGKLITPPLSNYILPGITRQFVLQLADRVGIEYQERPVRVRELPGMDEVFISATGIEIIPVNQLDGLRYQAPGPVFSCLRAAFDKSTKELRK